MSNYQLKENSGSIFKNDKKENDNHPDYRGKINIGGVEKNIALWVRETKSGQKYFSAQLSEQTTPQAKSQPEPIQKQSDDLPF